MKEWRIEQLKINSTHGSVEESAYYLVSGVLPYSVDLPMYVTDVIDSVYDALESALSREEEE